MLLVAAMLEAIEGGRNFGAELKIFRACVRNPSCCNPSALFCQDATRWPC
jgi:hypothetical protein